MQALYKSGNVAVQATVQVQNRPCTPAKSTPQRVAVSPTRESTDGALIRHFAAAAAAVQLLSCAPSYAMWDGESSAQGSCPLGDAGIECRKRLLA